jgi:hypothetical protein
LRDAGRKYRRGGVIDRNLIGEPAVLKIPRERAVPQTR